MIPRKQQSTHEEWLSTLHAAYDSPDEARASVLVEQAVGRIRDVEDRFGPVALAWSGGKDSQALRYCADVAGVSESVLVISELEWPAFLRFATDEMPWGLEIVQRPYGLEWLRRNPEMLFPDTKHAARWFALMQHAGQRDYMARRKFGALLLGRRRADGNYISRDGTLGYFDRGGWYRASVIGDWSHEDVLCVLGAYRVPLPPCYEWPRGFRIGSGPWPLRQWCPSPEAGWDEVATIDRTVVETAASAGIPGAAECLARCAD